MPTDHDHYNAMHKIRSTVARLPHGAEKVQFSRLVDAIYDAYSRYNSACVTLRVRPSPRAKQIADDLLTVYLQRRHDVEISLTLATLFIV